MQSRYRAVFPRLIIRLLRSLPHYFMLVKVSPLIATQKIGLAIFSEQLYATLCNIYSGHFYNSVQYLFCNHMQLYAILIYDISAILCIMYLPVYVEILCKSMQFLFRNPRQLCAILTYKPDVFKTI